MTAEHKGWTFTEAEPVKPDCANCKYWNLNTAVMGGPLKVPKTCNDGDTETVTAGRCQRHAPTAQGWPITRQDDWLVSSTKSANEPNPKA